MDIITAEDMYREVLNLLNKENTRTMTPSEFNSWINRSMIDYVKTKYFEYDQHQKRMDDINEIIVRTDGIAGNPAPIANAGNNVAGEEYFPLPYVSGGEPNFGYMFLLNVAFKINYIGNDCFTDNTESGWLKGKPYNADIENEANYYDRPQDDRLYYQIVGRNIRPFTGTSSYATQARLMYLRYPSEIEVDSNGLSVKNSEFEARVNYEIVKLCVRQYLESIESPRHQTFTSDESLNFN